MKTPTFPFTYESVEKELCDRRLTLARSVMGHSYYRRVGSVVLKRPGSWDVDGGALVVLDRHRRVVHRFDGLETSYGECRVAGESVSEMGAEGFVRSSMWPYESLGSEFSIVVSSHVDYRDVTVPRLLKTLRRSGLADDAVTVVVCGEKMDEGERQVDGVRHVFVHWDMRGFAGLAAGTSGSDYALLLHDTCSVDMDFLERVGAVDVGMPHDVILASNDNEIGLYSKRVIGAFDMEHETLKGFMRRRVQDVAISWTVMEGGVRTLAEKDVYGGGVKRIPVVYDGMGVRKFVGPRASGGRP